MQAKHVLYHCTTQPLFSLLKIGLVKSREKECHQYLMLVSGRPETWRTKAPLRKSSDVKREKAAGQECGQLNPGRFLVAQQWEGSVLAFPQLTFIHYFTEDRNVPIKFEFEGKPGRQAIVFGGRIRSLRSPIKAYVFMLLKSYFSDNLGLNNLKIWMKDNLSGENMVLLAYKFHMNQKFKLSVPHSAVIRSRSTFSFCGGITSAGGCVWSWRTVRTQLVRLVKSRSQTRGGVVR